MKLVSSPRHDLHRRATLVALGMTSLVAACGGSSGADVPGATRVASEAEWRSLAEPRPEPLPGAVRLSLASLELLGEPMWPAEAQVPPALGLTELVAAGLLRRADVRYVERRRFAAAVEAERAGRRPPAAPAAGVSPGAELSASVTWVALGAGGSSLEVRLADVASGRVVQTHRALLPAQTEPVGLSRAAVRAILDALALLGRLPSWTDPLGSDSAGPYAPSGVPPRAVADFLTGLGAEERWRWEVARESYQAAARTPRFFEAEAALARTARLRLGGTLGEG